MLAQVKKITEATVEGSPTKVEVSNIYLNDDFVQLGDETIVSAFFDFTLVYSSTESETLKNSIHSRVDLASCSLKSESATNVSGITLTKAE